MAIAVVKVIAGVLSGSAAMLAEAAHSVADTANQGFLLVSIQRGEREPDEEHPFGHGKERFFLVVPRGRPDLSRRRGLLDRSGRALPPTPLAIPSGGADLLPADAPHGSSRD